LGVRVCGLASHRPLGRKVVGVQQPEAQRCMPRAQSLRRKAHRYFQRRWNERDQEWRAPATRRGRHPVSSASPTRSAVLATSQAVSGRLEVAALARRASAIRSPRLSTSNSSLRGRPVLIRTLRLPSNVFSEIRQDRSVGAKPNKEVALCARALQPGAIDDLGFGLTAMQNSFDIAQAPQAGWGR
jgi:hypothetical protein